MVPPGRAFLYHFVPGNLTGEVLYPLNRLAELHPDVARTHREKYEGREWLLSARIPPLNCLWNDVLMLSPVHPARLLDALRAGGHDVPSRPCFEVDASLLAPERTTILVPHSGRLTLDDYQPFEAATLDRYSTPSITALERLRTYPAGTRAFLFAEVPHVLFRGTLRVGDLHRIVV